MSTTQDHVEDQQSRLERPIALMPRKARPVLWWAGLGAVFVVIFFYTFARWVIDMGPNVSAGPTMVPGYMYWNIHIQEVLLPLVGLIVLGKFVFKPLLRGRKLPWDGLAALAFLTLMWQSFGVNWFQWYSSFNAVVWNRGSWYEHVPFWLAPNAKEGFAETPLFDFGFYALMILVLIWFCFFMRAIKKRWPQMGNSGLFLSIFCFGMAFDFGAEVLWMRGGMYHYGGAIRGPWLLFGGHYYQFPLYECVLFGACLALMASVRYFRNDKGESFAERGIEELNISTKSKAVVRLLALTGIFNLLFFGYNASALPFILHSDPWPQDVTKRSYFTQGMCGGKTDRACPGPGVPIPRPGSSYITPDGKASHADDWDGPPGRKVPFMK